ncbi:MAG: LysM peptidoglycan-binding domain-containing protein [Melioribacteraceae bacterium]|nr:LysM peptidoglycan-binding domain-containing protein [Melioribacteraceae bacterium]MCO6472179.1 LysM peptidoglycan-binding domain-containing protein [Melioribacteraceae bacterium]MDD3557830.1 LysM peptidoglycan-binding domain-containing protein [Melioribacteraceae bacterium]
MKFKQKLAVVLMLLLALSVNLFAQEITEEEWQAEMNNLTAQRTALTKELDLLKTQIAELKETNASLQSYEDCQNDLYALVGATKQDVIDFRTLVNDLQVKISKQQKPKSDRQAELDNLKSSKISALPEFYDKVHNQMQRQLDAWDDTPDEILYTVVRGDNLWNIAKKPQHYGNGFAWPKIYNANRDQIKDPDLIYPKQVFKIPSLTEEEKAKYNKIRANYKPAPTTQAN